MRRRALSLCHNRSIAADQYLARAFRRSTFTGCRAAIRVKVDPGALATRGMTFEDVADAIGAGTAYSGAGQFDGANKSIILRPNGQISTAEGYRNLIIKQAAKASKSLSQGRRPGHRWGRRTSACRATSSSEAFTRLRRSLFSRSPGRPAQTRSRWRVRSARCCPDCRTNCPARFVCSRRLTVRVDREFAARRQGNSRDCVRRSSSL